MNTKLYIAIAIGIIAVLGVGLTHRHFAAAPEMEHEVTGPVTVVAENLNVPWELAFLPDGDMLITERPGKIIRMNASSTNRVHVEGVAHRGEGGLLGLALDPNIKENGFIYVYFTTNDGRTITNQVERYKLEDARLSNRTVVIKNIPGSTNHDGGRIAFGPDGMLYIATGDAGNEDNAQNKESLAGKILRIHPETFEVEIYSSGHRNVQGLAWDVAGQLWATEHGRSGIQSGYDELNKIVQGGNYGWPIIEGDNTKEGMVSPQIHSGSTNTWAPSGLAYLNNRLLFTGLKGESVYAADIVNGKAVNLQKYLTKEYGRLRTIVVSPDNMLYVLTNNTDGRGSPKAGDDKILRIDPTSLGL